MLHLQMVIPSLKTDASFTSTMKMDDSILMDLETAFHLPETSYQHKASLKYGNYQPPTCSTWIWKNVDQFVYSQMHFDIVLSDDDKLELELKSDLNSDIQNLIPNIEDHRRQLQQFIDHILDQRVAMTDMKYRHIVSKGIKVAL